MEVWIVYASDGSDAEPLGVADSIDSSLSLIQDTMYAAQTPLDNIVIEVFYSDRITFKGIADNQLRRFAAEKHRLTTA